MTSYIFKYKKSFFFRKIKAIGHKFDSDNKRMDVYHIDGSITSIAEWNKYTLFLGVDWVLFTKKLMEKESGKKIDLAIGE